MKSILKLIIGSFILSNIIILILLINLVIKNSKTLDINDLTNLYRVKQAMKFHGVLFAYKINNIWYSDRDGKRFKLFNQYYLSRRSYDN